MAFSQIQLTSSNLTEGVATPPYSLALPTFKEEGLFRGCWPGYRDLGMPYLKSAYLTPPFCKWEKILKEVSFLALSHRASEGKNRIWLPPASQARCWGRCHKSLRKYWEGTTAVWTKAPQSVGYGLVLAQGTVCYLNKIRTEIENKCLEIVITIWHCCDIKHTLLLCFTKVLDSDGLENTQQKETKTNKPQIRMLYHLQCEESCWHR